MERKDLRKFDQFLTIDDWSNSLPPKYYELHKELLMCVKERYYLTAADILKELSELHIELKMKFEEKKS